MSVRREAPTLRLFLDTNILVSGLLFAGPERDLLLAAEQGRFVAVVSEYVLTQVQRLLLVKFGLREAHVTAALDALPLDVTAEPSRRLLAEAQRLLRDPADAPVLAAAWKANVEGLVTGDEDFFAAANVRVRLLRTKEALALVGAGT